MAKESNALATKQQRLAKKEEELKAMKEKGKATLELLKAGSICLSESKVGAASSASVQQLRELVAYIGGTPLPAQKHKKCEHLAKALESTILVDANRNLGV